MTSVKIEPFVRPSNVALCHTLYLLSNRAYANGDDEGVEIYNSTMTHIIRTQRFSTADMKSAMTLFFVLYGSKVRKTRPGLIRLDERKKP